MEFNLVFNTSFSFFDPFTKLVSTTPKNYFLAQYTLELALFDMKFLKYKPSLLACSAIYLVNKIRRV